MDNLQWYEVMFAMIVVLFIINIFDKVLNKVFKTDKHKIEILNKDIEFLNYKEYVLTDKCKQLEEQNYKLAMRYKAVTQILEEEREKKND